MNSIKGKIAVVTGGTQGLGAAIANVFADAGAGGIVIVGRGVEKGAAVAKSITGRTGVAVEMVAADLGRIEDVQRIIPFADTRFGRVDILVNAAGLTDRGNVLNTTPELFDRMFAVNTRAPFFLMQDVAKVMIREGIEGRIVNIGSTSGLAGQPFLAPYADFLRRLFPAKVDPLDPSRPLYLDPAARETPIVALGGAAREAMRLADILEKMLLGAREAMVVGDRKLIADTKSLDDVLDSLNTAIKAYLTTLDADAMSEGDHRRLHEILAFSMNLEQAGDVVEQNFLPHVAKRFNRGLAFSKEAEGELRGMMDRLVANLRVATAIFVTEDLRAARLLTDEKPAFRDAETAATRSHFERLRAGGADTVEASTIRLDLLRDMKLINSHIVAAAAYPILEREGKLLPSRITTDALSD